jgi:membrane protease YdiL (CAAX protease family)
MRVTIEDTSNNSNNFSFNQLRSNHLAKVLVFPFVLWLMYILNYLDIVAFVHSLIFYGVAVVKRYSKDNYFIQISSFLLLLILGSFLIGHKIIGFSNYSIIDTIISNGAGPYKLWINKDSLIVGISLIIVFYKRQSFKSKDFVKMLLGTGCGIILLAGLGLFTGAIKIEVKYVAFFKVWLVFNIAYALVEEAFFRLFLLESIIRLYKGRYNVIIATGIIAIMFGLKHYIYGNFNYALLSAIASVLYSYVYMICGRRLECSVFCHVMTNVVHMIFFTYPFLSNS